MWHHVALEYDNRSGNGVRDCELRASLCRWGTGSVARHYGHIIQHTYDDGFWVRERCTSRTGQPSVYLWSGMIDYIRVSDIARYSAGTSFIPSIVKPTHGSNDILLLNFDLSAAIVGFGSTIAETGIVKAICLRK